MKRLLVPALLAAVALPHVAAQPAVAGKWWTPGFNAHVHMEACGDAVCGRIVWLWDETAKAITDKGPLIGTLVVDRMRAAEPGRWTGGRLFNPEDGRDYKGALHLQAPNRLVVDGCVLFVCQTQVWRESEPNRGRPASTTLTILPTDWSCHATDHRSPARRASA